MSEYVLSGLNLAQSSKGVFPQKSNFHVRKHANFTRVNKIEAMYHMEGQAQTQLS